MTRITKSDLREQARIRLRSLSAEELETKSRAICDLITSHLLTSLPEAAGVALFGGLRGEADLLPLLPEINCRGLQPWFFRIVGREMIAVKVRDERDLKRGALGVWEPADSLAEPIGPDELRIILIPGLAFDPSSGARLGRGAGYYDRFLSQFGRTAKRVGVGFDIQMLQGIPTEKHDIPMNSVVTETGITECTPFS